MKILKTIGWYAIQWTWGIVMNILGACAIFAAWITGEKVYRCGCHVYAYSKFCKNCAFSMGMFFILGYGCESCAPHEMGHGLQNLVFGPLMPFVVAIPSAIRFWIREYKSSKGEQLPPYDSVWFEGTATKYGHKYFGAKWDEHLLNRKAK